MPRRRTRTTNRRPQAERHLRVRGIRRRTPDPKKLSRAFIALALARAETEARAQAEQSARQTARQDHDQPAKQEEANDGGP